MTPSEVIAGIKALTALGNLVANTVAERKRTGELTPEEEAAWDAHVSTRMDMAHWMPSKAKKPK
jgi:hypothetical protein